MASSINKILLGRLKSDAGTCAGGENIFLEKQLNADLERVLDALWDYACKAVQPKELAA